jgi:pyruvate dehydrogenase E2 component (dihydrolipoamide acetyltransferase)
MAEKILMLALSPTMEEGTIAKWNKKIGDEVKSGEVLCEIETDKATMDYEVTQSGTLLHIEVDQGKSARVGDLIAVLGAPGEDFSDLIVTKKESGTAAPSHAAPKEQAGAAPKVQAEPTAAVAVHAEPMTQHAAPLAGKRKISPLARKIAQQQGLDLSQVVGSGPLGRVVKRDVEAYVQKHGATGALSHEAPSVAGAVPAARHEDRIIPVTNKRKVIARRLSESKFSAPHYYLKVTVDADRLLEARKSMAERQGTKVSLNAFLIKLVAEALKKHPMVNASWGEQEIRQFGESHIGLAVAQEDGLVTPVVRNAGQKGIRQIDEELGKLIAAARTGALKIDEMSGASFTISNLGSYDIDEFTAIINPPASAILAVGAAKKAVVADKQDQIKIVTQMKLTLSCDHRIVDGAVGAEFLRDLKQMLEEPLLALL